MELKEVFEPITNFLKNFQKKQKDISKDKAKERLQLVLMQDRASVSPDFFEMMKKEIIDVIKKYIDIDEELLEVQLTRGYENGDDSGPALYANIPIKNIKPVAKKADKNAKKEIDVAEGVSEVGQKIEEIKDSKVETIEEKIEKVEETKVEESKVDTITKKEEIDSTEELIEDIVIDTDGVKSYVEEFGTKDEKTYDLSSDNSTKNKKSEENGFKSKFNNVKESAIETFSKVRDGAKDSFKKIKNKAANKNSKKKLND